LRFAAVDDRRRVDARDGQMDIVSPEPLGAQLRSRVSSTISRTGVFRNSSTLPSRATWRKLRTIREIRSAVWLMRLQFFRTAGAGTEPDSAMRLIFAADA
jgi:hypothetical protein